VQYFGALPDGRTLLSSLGKNPEGTSSLWDTAENTSPRATGTITRGESFAVSPMKQRSHHEFPGSDVNLLDADRERQKKEKAPSRRSIGSNDPLFSRQQKRSSRDRAIQIFEVANGN